MHVLASQGVEPCQRRLFDRWLESPAPRINAVFGAEKPVSAALTGFAMNRHTQLSTVGGTAPELSGFQDDPSDAREFEAMFSSERTCRNYLERLRWPTAFSCPRCEHDKAWALGKGLFQCAVCGHQTSVTAGTIFEGTRKPLKFWFRAMWWLANQKAGASACGLQRALGLHSYQTAWTWLHKLRTAMEIPSLRLDGTVDVGAGHVQAGGRDRPDRRKRNHCLIAIAFQVGPSSSTKLRLGQIAACSTRFVAPLLQTWIRPGSVIRADDRLYEALHALPDDQFKLQRLGRDSAKMNSIEWVEMQLQRWLTRAHQKAVSSKHLDFYLDEFAFRFNYQYLKSPRLIFSQLLRQAVTASPVTYRSIIQNRGARHV